MAGGLSFRGSNATEAIQRRKSAMTGGGSFSSGGISESCASSSAEICTTREPDVAAYLRTRSTSSDGLVSAYRRESQKQKLLIRKAKVCDDKLLFLVTAFTKLLADENFVNLLRAESLFTMPKFLAIKMANIQKEAA